MVVEVPSTLKDAPVADLYRLTLTCNAGAREGEMQLAWSPGVPKQGQAFRAEVDGKHTLTYKVEGTETMGNGGDSKSGPGSLLLSTSKPSSPAAMPLPARTLVIRDAFPGETVEFPFAGLDGTARKALAACFPSSRGKL
jgi:hypothetical protein